MKTIERGEIYIGEDGFWTDDERTDGIETSTATRRGDYAIVRGGRFTQSYSRKWRGTRELYRIFSGGEWKFIR